MRSFSSRLVALVAAVVVVVSCDTRLPTQAVIGGTGSSSKDAGTPTISIDTPATGALVNVSDSVLVVLHLHDDKSLSSATVTGLSYKGSADLGTLVERVRYTPVTMPTAGIFRDGLRDTVLRRYIKLANAADTSQDSLVIRAIVRDLSGSADTVTKTVQLILGPKVAITSPVTSDSVPAGVGLGVTVKAQHPDGISRISVRVQGEASWPTKLDTTITQTFAGAPRDQTFLTVARIPINAPVRSRVTVSATAVDVNGQLGSSAAVTVFVRNASTAQPRVTQVVLPRVELGDTIQVTAKGDGIAAVGYVARDSNGTVLKRDSIRLTSPFPGNVVRAITFDSLPPAFQGKKVAITAFAVDQSGRTGYAVRPSQTTPEGTLANGLVDSTLVVYGRTYKMPRSGIVGDIAVDRLRGNVIVSNTAYNRLEIWQNTPRRFDALGVAVGSMPWGLFISNNPDTLFVANSGGTNISRVYIGAADPRNIREDEARRILTRGTYIFVLNEIRDENTGKVSISKGPEIIFSDRPQYIGQLVSGDIFYSTRPTSTSTQGTIRRIDPTQAVPDPQPILMKQSLTQDLTNYIIVNADSVGIRRASVNSGLPDTLDIFDHPPGTALPSEGVSSTTGVGAAIAAMRAKNGSDVTFFQGVDPASTGLTDTTYVSISGDRRWMAFGEGNRTIGRIVMLGVNGFTSPTITQNDLTNNAAERVNGLALDFNGTTLAAHGTESFFSAVESPFHLRLQGKYQGFNAGAGIAFHPGATGGPLYAGLSGNNSARTAFVASNNKTIEVVDVLHYINRGRLDLKDNLYGPLRASLPLPGDAPDIVLKLFGLTTEGLVVIDLRASDILPVP